MLFLKCTQQVQRFWNLPLQPAQLAADNPTMLGAWYVNFFTVDRRKMIIFLNERTRLSFVMLGAKKAHRKTLHLVFARGLAMSLDMAGIPLPHINRVLQEYTELRYARTDDRATLGCMVELVKDYQYFILDSGGLGYTDLGALIKHQNEMPQRALAGLKPASAVRVLLQVHGLVPQPADDGDPALKVRLN